MEVIYLRRGRVEEVPDGGVAGEVVMEVAGGVVEGGMLTTRRSITYTMHTCLALNQIITCTNILNP